MGTGRWLWRGGVCTAWVFVLASAEHACAQHASVSGGPGSPKLDWRALEAPFLTGHVQLTSRDRFTRAGEAYFSPDGSTIVFQATPVPPQGQQPSPHYEMYVATLVRDAAGAVVGMGDPVRISPEGSANTCGWFHPRDPELVLFGSTLVEPSLENVPGFQRATGRYQWAFPPEMEIVTLTLVRSASGEVQAQGSPIVLFDKPDYTAEASWSPDGRHVLYAQVDSQRSDQIGRTDADIWCFDTQSGEHHRLIAAPGYDGGPFFSPDGLSIAYRSDRRGNSQLQLFVAELARDGRGVIVGVSAEHQLTDNGHVNWAPYWHPSGRFLVYGSSEVGHTNYELFAVRVDFESLRKGVRIADIDRVRLTFGGGADVLPVFSSDGRSMMWTAQRGPMVDGEQRPSSQLWIAQVNPSFDVDRLFRFISRADAQRVAEAALETQVAWAARAAWDSQWNDLGWVWTAKPPTGTQGGAVRIVLARDGRVLSMGPATEAPPTGAATGAGAR